MIYTELTMKAMRACFTKHKEQVDESNVPYVFHPFHLAESMTSEYSTCVALLHDTIEDTDTTLEDLIDMGFPKEVVDAVKLLTHDKSVPYMDYVRNLKSNPIAREVKIADLIHNTDITRLSVVTAKDLQRIEKYKEAISILKE